MISDWLMIKTVEKQLGRPLTDLEIRGIKRIKVTKNGQVEFIRIAQVHMLYLHQKNNCN